MAAIIDGSVTPPSGLAKLRLMAVLGTLLAFASISTDLFLPALPTMQRALDSTQNALELVISGYLVGFSLGQLVWGPLSDRLGRRLPIAAGLVLFVIGCAGCALSTSASMLIAFRVVQALGACASVVLGRAIVRDFYARDQAAKMLSTLMTVMAIAPLGGPIVGSLILQIAPWQAIFWTLVLVGLATLGAVFTIADSLPPDRRNREPLSVAFGAYGALVRDPRLFAYASAIGLYYAGIFASIAGSSFAYIDFYHLTPQLFGVAFAVGIVGLMITSAINARLVVRVGGDRMLVAGGLGAALAGMLLAIVAMTGLGGLWAFAIAMWAFTAMNGLVAANAVSGALADFPTRAGAVSALMGAAQYGCGILGSAASGVLANGTPVPMALIIAVCGIGTFGGAIVARQLNAKSSSTTTEAEHGKA